MREVYIGQTLGEQRPASESKQETFLKVMAHDLSLKDSFDLSRLK